MKKKCLKEILTLSFSFLFIAVTYSQQNILQKISNYAPTSSVKLNPSSIVDSKTYIDMTFLGVDIMGSTNAGKLEKGFLMNIFKNKSTKLFNFSNTLNGKKGFFNSTVNLFSYNINLKRHAFGISFGAVGMGSFYNIKNFLLKHIQTNFKSSDFKNVDLSVSKVNLNFSAWSQISLSYAYIIQERKKNISKIGITGKYLTGIASANMFIDNLKYIVNDNQVKFMGNRGTFNYDPTFSFENSGFSTDIGFSFIKTINTVDRYIPFKGFKGIQSNYKNISEYNYKIGVSIIDLGYVSYKSENAKKVNFNDNTTETFSTEEDFLHPFDVFYEASENNFTVMLPPAFSLQFDKNLNKGMYANATIIQDISFIYGENNRLRRSSGLNLSFRYETSEIELGTALVLHEYSSPTVAFNMRLWRYFFLGSDNLLSLIGITGTSSLSIYTGFKFFKLENRKKYKRKIVRFSL